MPPNKGLQATLQNGAPEFGAGRLERRKEGASTKPMNQFWLDFGGAPPILLPAGVVSRWRGTTNPCTGEHQDYNSKSPVTDYDRACVAVSSGPAVLAVADAKALVAYAEQDDHTWVRELGIIASGGWIPSTDQLVKAMSDEAVAWRVTEESLVLANSAADGRRGLSNGDAMPIQIRPGNYVVEMAIIECGYLGIFHKLRPAPGE